MARTTTRSGRREMNPTDAYRKRQRKKEVQKNKKERKKVREFSAMVRNPDLMVEEVRTENNLACTPTAVYDLLHACYCLLYDRMIPII